MTEMTAKQYLNQCRTTSFLFFAKLEQKEQMIAKVIYSSPGSDSVSANSSVSDKIQSITNEIIMLDKEIETLQKARVQYFKKIMLIDDVNAKNVILDFYVKCYSYTRISKTEKISRSTLKRRLKKGIEIFEKILKTS